MKTRKRRETVLMTQTQAPAVATQPESTTDPDCIFCKIITGEVPSAGSTRTITALPFWTSPPGTGATRSWCRGGTCRT